MRKDQLIKLLQEIKGNPEVVLWNGYVGDYMHIDNLVKSDLVKITKAEWVKTVLFEEMRSRKDWNYRLPQSEVKELERRHRTELEYQIDEYITEEDIKQKKYKRKSVVFIQPKKRGVKTFDRIGSIEY